MANHTIDIIIRAKNAVAAGLSSAGKSLKSFGSSVWDFGKKAAIGIAAVATALAGFGAKAVSAYAESEAAVQSLKSALGANGEEVDKNTEKLQAQAKAIQDETGASDDATVATMGRLSMLGVETEALGTAAKAVLALKSAGMDEEAAAKAVAMAHAGNFGALARYIPALKNATSEAEKATIVNDFLAKGYQAQKDKLGTVSGAWAALKERVGDVWEEIGAAIAQNDGLQKMFTQAADAVKRFGERIAEWAAGGGVTKLIAGFKLFGENARYTWNIISLTFGTAIAKISDGWSTTVNYISNLLSAMKGNFVAEFTYIKDMAVAVFDKIKHPMSEFKPPSMEPLKKALSDYVDAVKGKDAKVSTMTDAAMRLAEQEETRHAAAVEGIIKKMNDDVAAQSQPKAETPPPVMDPIVIAQQNKAKMLMELRKKELEADKAYREQEIEGRKAALEKQKALAAMTIAAYLAEVKGKQDAQKALQKDQEKADRLIARQKVGAKLGKRQQDWLNAQIAIGMANKFLPAKEAMLREREKELLGLQKKQAGLLEDIRDNIDDVMRMG